MPVSPFPNCEGTLPVAPVVDVEVVEELLPPPQAARKIEKAPAAPVPPAMVRKRFRDTGSLASFFSAPFVSSGASSAVPGVDLLGWFIVFSFGAVLAPFDLLTRVSTR